MELGRDFSKQDVSQIKIKTDYSVEYGLTQNVHFCLGSALLTEEARQALRIMCANELTSFMSPGSTLAIIGHTDPVGTKKDNFALILNPVRIGCLLYSPLNPPILGDFNRFNLSFECNFYQSDLV